MLKKIAGWVSVVALLLVLLLLFAGRFVEVSAQGIHGITVAWNPPAGFTGLNYNVYSATAAGGPYSKQTAAPVSATNFFFATPNSNGVKFYFVVRSVDTLGAESVNSNEINATAIGNPGPPAGVTAVAQ